MTDELRPLTSLRFVAAAMIVLFHVREIFPWAWTEHLPGFLPTGVSFFFVLSGFILTHVYRTKQVSYSRFIWLRIARLWPTHIAMLFIVMALFAIQLLPSPQDAGWFDSRLTAFANVFMLQSYIPFPAYYFAWDGPSWSISAEFFFYLLFPLLLTNIDRTWHWKLGAAFALSLSITLLVILSGLPNNGSPTDLAAISFIVPFPPMRLCEFCLGMAANVLWRRHVQSVAFTTTIWTALECAALLFTIGWLTYFSNFVWRTPYFPLAMWGHVAEGAPIFALLIVVLASGRGLLGILFSRREFVYLGEISFSLYMLHQPLMLLVQTYAPDIDFSGVLLAVGTLLAGSAALHAVIEKPCRALLTQRSLIFVRTGQSYRGGSISRPARFNTRRRVIATDHPASQHNAIADTLSG